MAFSNVETTLPLALRYYSLVCIFFCWSSTLVSAQPAPTFNINPVNNFCSRWYQQTVVKNNVLFIDSGLQKYGSKWIEPNPYFGINNYLLTIPLDFTWDWKTNIVINAEPKNEKNPNTGTLPPSLMRGHLFHGPADTAEIYNYGGTTYMANQSFPGYVQPDASTYSLWTYTYGTQDYPWAQYDISQPWRANHGAAAEAIDQSLGFYLNGQIDWGTSTLTMYKTKSEAAYMPVEGMLVINFTDHTSTNISTPKLRGDKPRVGGGIEYFPSVGASGVLVALGGQVNNGSGWLNNTKGELLDFSTVDVWDIDSYLSNSSSNGTWYQQSTTGTIPPPRIDFCTVSISAPDNSSHHVYLYGGIDPTLTNHSGYDDVYVLSMPSFSWTPIFTNGNSPRWGHNCHIAGNRQMITVGGNTSDTEICDWESKGVAVLDMSAVTWGSVFRSNASAYELPQAILSATGGKQNGSAKITKPIKGWTDTGLQTVFATTRKTTVTTPSSTAAPATEKKKSIAGPVAGGVAGGVLALALIAGILFFLRRRRQKARAPNELHGDGISPPVRTSDEKDKKYELQGVNENNPAELPGPEAVELNAPREFVEADNNNATTRAAELSGTSIAPGGSAGTPHVRTPGDDLPETPFYTPGLIRRRSSMGFTAPQTTKETRQVEEPASPGIGKAITKDDPN